MAEPSAHIDTFTRDNLPPRHEWPDFIFPLPALRYPARLNCASVLLDDMIAAGHGASPCVRTPQETWSYAALKDKADRIARVLTEDLGVVPGNRVLLRAPNTPMMAACWFGVVKAGAVAVATMPLLRAGELTAIADKARIALALCDARLRDELDAAMRESDALVRIVSFGEEDELERLMAAKPAGFTTVDTAAGDICMIAFTSGTTGNPKGTMHVHRDILAVCDCFPRHTLKPEARDVFCGSPPLAFTFGLGGLLLFPLRVGASALLIERPTPDALLDAVQSHGATVLVTAPTAYRAMLPLTGDHDLGGLRRCVSAGETLPRSTFEAWQSATGNKIIDGIGSTELLHIFIAAADEAIRPGATGRVVPGYEARVVDDAMNTVAPGTVGRLAVRGPTGCRYLADPRQRDYVVAGWNLTGDAYVEDEDGYFWFQARTDDMIISAGYNIAAPEVEDALLAHEAVAECAVVAAPDPARGNIVKAYVVLRAGAPRDAAQVDALQRFVKERIAPYKYPRAIEFTDTLPRTGTGKVQRFRLRAQAADDVREAC